MVRRRPKPNTLDITSINGLIRLIKEFTDPTTDQGRLGSSSSWLVEIAYRFRADGLARRVGVYFGLKLTEMLPLLMMNQQLYDSIQINDFANRVSKLITLLCEEQDYARAEMVCNQAIQLNIGYRKRRDFEKRLEEILKLSSTNMSLSAEEHDEDSEGLIRLLVAERKRLKRERTVPRYFGGRLKEKQAEFFNAWKEAWRKGQLLDAEGQISYIEKYIRTELQPKGPTEEVAGELVKLGNPCNDKTEDERDFGYRCRRAGADCYIYLGHYRKAIESCHLPLGDFLSLKVLLGESLSGEETIDRFGQTSLTEFGRKNLEKLYPHIERLIQRHSVMMGNDLLQEWASRSEVRNYRVFGNGLISKFQELPILEYMFMESPSAPTYVELLRRIIRDAENDLRGEMGIPKIGEGWRSETELWYAVKTAFPNLTVLQHASPIWLGKQHLDIFIPELNMAIEYQGPQHDTPVDFFGGEESLELTRRRDALKRDLCTRNNVKLLYVHPGYELEAVFLQIHDLISNT